MRREKTEKLRASATGLRVLVISVLAFALAGLYGRSGVHQFIETRVSMPYLFNARELLGASAPLHPKLKILTYDDSTVSTLKSAEMSLEQWASLLTALDAKQPSLIVIDQIFALTPRSEVDKAELLAKLKTLKTKVVTAAFVSERPISQRPTLDLAQRQYQLRGFFADTRAMLLSGFPPLTKRLGWTAYGPNPDLAPYFNHVGHALDSGLGFANALVQLSGSKVLPHMSLLGSESLSISRGQLYLEGVHVPLDEHGRMIVDFSSPKTYYKHSQRLLKLVKNIEAGQGVGSDVEAGDLVLILPAMFTGSTDFAETPVGQLPGGFVIASLLNSRLRHEWIRPVDPLDGPLPAGIVLGAVASVASGFWFVPALMLLGLAWLGTGTLLFAKLQIYTSLSAPFLGAVLTAGLILAERYRLRERLFVLMRLLNNENERLQSELDQAGEIARVFIPAKVPLWPGFTIGVYHRPLSSASGDWYAFETSDAARYQHFLMCDISGHGAQAAIIVSTCKTVLSMMVAEGREALDSEQFVAQYARRLNDVLCVNGAGYHTTTFLGVTFEVASRRVHCVCAGHPQPFRFKDRQEDRGSYLGAHSTLLGITPGLKFHASSFEIEPGDSVLAYTDGVPFPRSPVKVRRIFTKYRHLDPDSGAKYMAVEACERQQNFGRLIEDDISLVWFRWHAITEKKKAA